MPETSQVRILRDFGFTPVVGTEIEFYLHGAGGRLNQQEVVALLRETAAREDIALFSAEAERGPDQYEISLPHSRDILKIAADTERFKAAIASAFLPYGARADFSAKPARDIPGSGLHVHVHLEDGQGRNVFTREEEIFSTPLLHSIGGLLATMNEYMRVFAPRPESRERFLYTVNGYLICPTAANVPLTVSWGTNNRTVAVRLPGKPADDKHLEHRVAGADADIAAVIEAVLSGVHHGLTHRCDPGEPTYGDASLEQYGLPKLQIK